MAINVVVYQIAGTHRRSKLICEAMMTGIKARGDNPTLRHEHDYREPEAEVAVFYGFVGKLPQIMRDYRDAGLKAVYVDLGYWGRHDGGRWSGFHKVVVNSRHPTEYFQAKQMGPARASRFHVRPAAWSENGQHILLAGMGDKGAEAEGYKPEQWERSAIEEIRRYTDRRIIYRPKPSWKTAKPIEGAQFSAPQQPLDVVLKTAHAVVTHHSNVAVEGLVAGVPAFCWDGVAKPMSGQDLSRIENPHRPEGRQEWINNIAWVQWSIPEMHLGKAWGYLKDEGLIS
jgi:hypothetical protein